MIKLTVHFLLARIVTEEGNVRCVVLSSLMLICAL